VLLSDKCYDLGTCVHQRSVVNVELRIELKQQRNLATGKAKQEIWFGNIIEKNRRILHDDQSSSY